MIDDVPDVAPHCELCNSPILTIKHIMLECEQLRDTIQDCLKKCRCNRAPNMRDLLRKKMKFFEVICFFEEYRSIQFNLNLLQVLSNWDVNCNTLKNVFV